SDCRPGPGPACSRTGPGIASRAWCPPPRGTEVGQKILTGDDARGLAIDEDEGGAGISQQGHRFADRLAASDGGQRGRHVLADRVRELRAADKERVEEVTLDD